MTQHATPAHALAAAQGVARDHGIACDDAVVLAAGSNVLVHLRPAPVVARVMTGTAMLHSDVPAWLAGEIAAGAFLGDRGLAVPPATELPPGPHEYDGLWLTFWAFVEHDASRPPTSAELGAALRDLHAAFPDFPGALPPLSGIGGWLQSLVAELRPSAQLPAAEIDNLARSLHDMTPAVFDSRLPAQPLHGDTAVGNLLRTDSGLLWNDLEDVCIGPVHWDLAGLVAEASSTGQTDRYIAELLDAYGAVTPGELALFIEAHRLYAAIWHAYSAQHRSLS